MRGDFGPAFLISVVQPTAILISMFLDVRSSLLSRAIRNVRQSKWLVLVAFEAEQLG